MDPPAIRRLSGDRLHLSHGPIDVVLRAWGAAAAVRAAEASVVAAFPDILPGLAAELPALRRPMAESPRVTHPVARRMVAACARFAPIFVTPMAAVAGAVADALLAEMLRAAPLARAYVNDGGDIALHVAPGELLAIGLAADPARLALDGALHVTAGSGIGGVATSGRFGRSLSLGIADAVTVLARDAATADAAATLIANAVDIDSAGVRRAPARSLDPDSDLGDRLVTVAVDGLMPAELAAALDAGLALAEAFRADGRILGAALRLGDGLRVTGLPAPPPP
ncbi:UPF0280 family protein [Roseomonas sp. CECT 9278]|uniref:UPF0280 family protein n=1 Tax=Roseomonas sp. CECT 9278 TaxID=2845823 RepID=UPI001E5E22BB|nr:UPF0280 family protein [Roseomonas sp. CECT 9278]CAH0293539.1 hypothetical protein ROS9278_04303 [Roseomonas sp. CECT 9278]